MRIFSTFSGIGGFEIGIHRAFETSQERLRQESSQAIRIGHESRTAKGYEKLDSSAARLLEHPIDSGNRQPHCVGHSEIDKYAIKVYEKQFGGECENCRLARERKRNSGTSGRQETVDSERTRLSQTIGGNDNVKDERSESDRVTCEHAPKNFGDITKINAEELPDFDCLVGGFPCQAFSIAGKRQGFDDTRGTLFFDLARILRAKQPRYFVFENVKGLLSHDQGNTFRTIIATIDELGYDCQWSVLNSKNFGVPQNRERVIIVGHLRGTPRPEVFPISGTDQEDTRIVGQDVAYTIDANYSKGTNTLAKGRRSVVAIPEATKKGHAEATIGQAINLSVPNSKTRRGRVSDIAPTLDTGMQLHTLTEDVRIRRLTPIECERLQGFPDDWTKIGVQDGVQVEISDTQRYKMCGNAVTTNVVQAVFERIFETTMEANQ